MDKLRTNMICEYIYIYVIYMNHPCQKKLFEIIIEFKKS